MRTVPRLIALLAVSASACFVPAAAASPQILRMSTTTSTDNSGLLKYLLPAFEADSGLKVKEIAVGTGKALELAKNGDVDVTLVHARPAEDKFVAAGYGINRRDVMYNDFVIVGPPGDPAGVAKAGHDVYKGLRRIVKHHAKFISRGDNSGTDQKEQIYWKHLGMKPSGDAYVSAGQGMGAVLNMAGQMQAYTLTDRATFLAYRAKTGLKVLLEGDPRLFNPYGIIAVNPKRHPDTNFKGAMALIDWITSPRGQQKIAAFRIGGRQVFFPDAGKSKAAAGGTGAIRKMRAQAGG